MELVKVMDEKGEFTGEIITKTEVHDRNLLHDEAVVFISNDKNQLLLQKRSLKKRLAPGMWALTAGHVTADEEVIDTVIRELEEELGLQVTEQDIKPIQEKIIAINPIHSHIMHVFDVKTNWSEEEFIVQEDELEYVKWFEPDEIIAMLDARDPNIPYEKEIYDIFKKYQNKEI